MQDYSKQAMIDFIEYVGNKHLVKPSAAKNWKTASAQFLDLLDNDEAMDLRTLDIDHLGERYAHSKGNTVKPDSIRLYLARFRSAYGNFMQYAGDKLNYRPSTSTRTRASIKKEKPKAPSGETKSSAPKAQSEKNPPSFKSNSPSDGVEFPVPISEGRIVMISNLPYELRRSDAEKIANVIKALAMPDLEN